MPKNFTLVHWVEEDSFGIMPASAVMISPDKLYVGCMTKIKLDMEEKAV